MANPENLIPNSQRSPIEHRESSRKGGIASGKARRRKREMKETLDIILNMPIKQSGKPVNIEDIQSYASLNGKNVTTEEAMLLMQIKKALKGDSRAFELIRDTAGQKPVDKLMVAEVEQEVIDEVESIVLNTQK